MYGRVFMLLLKIVCLLMQCATLVANARYYAVCLEGDVGGVAILPLSRPGKQVVTRLAVTRLLRRACCDTLAVTRLLRHACCDTLVVTRLLRRDPLSLLLRRDPLSLLLRRDPLSLLLRRDPL